MFYRRVHKQGPLTYDGCSTKGKKNQKNVHVAQESHHFQNRYRSSYFITSFQYNFLVVLNTIFKETFLNLIILCYFFLIDRIIHIIVDGINKVIKSKFMIEKIIANEN